MSSTQCLLWVFRGRDDWAANPRACICPDTGRKDARSNRRLVTGTRSVSANPGPPCTKWGSSKNFQEARASGVTCARYGCDPSSPRRDGSAACFARGPVTLQVAPADAPRGCRQVSVGSKIEEQPVYAIVDWKTRASASYSQAKR